MKISYNWLKQYVDIKANPEKVGEWLTDTGLEVEGIKEVESIPGGLKGLVIGQVKTCTKHPNADRLNVTTVDIDQDELLHIVCGAPNVAVGQKVVVATVGAMLYPSEGEPFKIKKGKIRGEVSEGMICAEDEIGLGQGHDGIMVLDDSAQVGAQAASYFNIESDFVFEIGLTPNRADATSHIGTARDLVALSKVEDEVGNVELKWPNITGFKVDQSSLNIPVEVKDTAACPRYSALTISDVKVQASPDWLKNRLNAIGVRPINNVVDITNFVLHEMGQPLHAFDAAKIKGQKVLVQTTPEGTPFTTLDETERKLNANDLMICNGEEPMCIAGVFGGISSGVSEETTHIFLESAYFNAVSVRKTAKSHGLNTDASFRYERGTDPNITIVALKRAAMLIKELAGGTISGDVIDIYPNKIDAFDVTLRFEQCNKIIGKTIEKEVIKSILRGLEIEIASESDVALELKVPPFKVDVTREIDVIEEVLRIYGYNNIELPEKLSSSLSYSPELKQETLRNRVADALVANGLSEAMHNSLTSSDYYTEDLGFESKYLVAMANPLSVELDVMRGSLVFQMLESIQRNQNRQQLDVKLFEFGKTYWSREGKSIETTQLVMALFGSRTPESWMESAQEVSFFDLKKQVNFILDLLGLAQMRVQWKEASSEMFDYGLQLSINKRTIGELGQISSKLSKQFGIKSAVYMADLNWDQLLDLAKSVKVKFSPISKFPKVRRDLALLVDNKVSFDQLHEAAKQAERKLLTQVNLFDVYEGKNLPKGKKSYALSFTLENDQKTLVDKQVEKVMQKIQSTLEKEFDAELRK
mgnify:CR=1 FL=1